MWRKWCVSTSISVHFLRANVLRKYFVSGMMIHLFEKRALTGEVKTGGDSSITIMNLLVATVFNQWQLCSLL